jgi:hypothetical protein
LRLLRGGSRIALPGCASQERFDAHQEDAQIEGLGKVVVRARLNSFQDIFGPGARCQHKDGGEAFRLAQSADDIDAIRTRKHAVENDGGYRLIGVQQIFQGSVAVGFVMGAVSFRLQIEQQALRQVLLVFNDGNQGGIVAFLQGVHTLSFTMEAGLFAAG